MSDMIRLMSAWIFYDVLHFLYVDSDSSSEIILSSDPIGLSETSTDIEDAEEFNTDLPAEHNVISLCLFHISIEIIMWSNCSSTWEIWSVCPAFSTWKPTKATDCLYFSMTRSYSRAKHCQWFWLSSFFWPPNSMMMACCSGLFSWMFEAMITCTCTASHVRSMRKAL